MLLQDGVLFDAVFGEFEFEVRVSAESASACAGGVDDQPVDFASSYLLEGLLGAVELGVGDAGSVEPLPCLAESHFSWLVDEYLPLALEKMGDGQRLAAAAPAIVENQVSRLDLCSEGNQLRAFVLDLKESVPELLSVKEVDILGGHYFESEGSKLTLLESKFEFLLQAFDKLTRITTTSCLVVFMGLTLRVSGALEFMT